MKHPSIKAAASPSRWCAHDPDGSPSPGAGGPRLPRLPGAPLGPATPSRPWRRARRAHHRRRPGRALDSFCPDAEKITNVLVVDKAVRGEEGVWTTFARMVTLRTPKHVCGPDLGIGSLTPRAWCKARFGAAAWEGLGKIRVNAGRTTSTGTAMCSTCRCGTKPRSSRSDRRATSWPPRPTAARCCARKIVLATGIAGSGAWHIPDFIETNLPRGRWGHTSEASISRPSRASAWACWAPGPRPSTMPRRRWKPAPACATLRPPPPAAARESLSLDGIGGLPRPVRRPARTSCAGASCGTSSP